MKIKKLFRTMFNIKSIKLLYKLLSKPETKSVMKITLFKMTFQKKGQN